MTNNEAKDLRFVDFKKRDQGVTREFKTRYIPKGNNIVTDCWSS